MYENKEFKITFVGDLMCEKPLQRRINNSGNDIIKNVFKDTKKMFNDSDYVVANLETVFAGSEKGYTKELYSFNTPDEFANAIFEGGINMVTTATNHCLDRGLDGLKRTIEVLDNNGIEHVGTNLRKSDDRFLIKKFGDIKVAFLNYTYGTNTHETGLILKEDELFCVNLLKPQTFNLQTYLIKKRNGKVKVFLSSLVDKVIGREGKIRIKKVLNMDYNYVRVDHLNKDELSDEYIVRIKEDVKKAKTSADVVIVCLHSGGQFNEEPGEFTKYMVNMFAECGVDAVVGSHPHVVQKSEYIDECYIAYSLGNYSISPSSVYLLNDFKPEYGVSLHLYLKDGMIVRVGFSILKMVESTERGLEVVPVDILYELLDGQDREDLICDVTYIYNRFTGSKEKKIPIKKEYKIKDMHK